MQKKFLIIIVVLLVVILGGASYFVLSQNKKGGPQKTQAPGIEEGIEAEEISSQELGLKVTLRPDKKAIKFEIENASDIELVEYQISYTKEVSGEEVPEGLIGEARPENGRIETEYREFGTCSSGICRYDKVVSDIKLTLKVTKTNGKIYQAEESISL